jgi:hypothetical protein
MQRQFVLCIHGKTDDQTSDITPRRVYEVLPDVHAENAGMMGIVDDSGEDYLYSASFFLPIMLPHEAEEIFDVVEVG